MNHFNHLSKSSFVRSDFVFLGLALLAAAGAMAQPVALEDGGEWAVEHVKASGTVRTIQDADSILSGASPFVSRNEARVPYLDFASDGGAGVFALNQPFPNAAAGGDDFVVRARGSIRMARGGVVTLGVGSDDGFRLRIDGVELASSANRAFAFTLVATNLAEGPHEVELVTWEATGAAGLEFVVARAHGDLASENEAVTTDRFRLMPASPPARIAAETEVVLRRGGLWDLRQRQRLEPPTAFGSMDEAEALLTASTGFEELTLSSGPAVLDHLSIGDPGYFGGDSAFPINGDSDRDSVVRGTARIFVERAGVHTFAVQASDTGRLRVDGRVVAANRAGAEPWNRVVGESKPVAWWRMDDADERAGVVTNRGSAAGHLGTLVGATLGIEGALGIGQAAAFNGTEFHRIESNVTEPITGPATLEYLLFGDDEGGAQALHDDGVQSIRMEQWSNTGLLGATRYGVGDYLFAPWSTGSTRSPFDRWVHLLFVRETLPAPRVKVYLDGALAGVLDVDLPFPVAVLGSKPASDGFTGWIDESVIYDRALGEDEIRAHQRIFDSARPGGVGLGSVELTEGWHEIEVTAWIRPGRGGLEVMVAGELGALTEFDPNRFQLLEASRPDAEGEPRVIAVTTTDPTGPGSLNAALVSLREAPADGAPAVIDLRAVRGRIGLTGPLPVIDRTTRILGPGEHLLTISSGGSNRVFWVAAGDVEFRDMTIADGWDRGEDSEGTGGGGLGAGAGLFVDSSAWVTVERVTFERNRVEGGVSRWVGGNSGGVGGSGFRTVMGDDGPVVEGIVGSNGSGGGSGADGSGLSGIHGRSGAAGSSGSAGRAGTEGSSFGGGGGGGGGGGSGGAGGAGGKGRNTSPRGYF
ncbi:MAG: LamG-like jellyroll fold domain-containing protein, partial [Limisphaerales bacterium]